MRELAPEIENNILDYAKREGVSINELLARTFPRRASEPNAKALSLIAAVRQWQLEDRTDDEDELIRRDQESAELYANLNQARERAGMRPLFLSEG